MKIRRYVIRAIDTLRRYKRMLVPSGEALIFAGILALSYLIRVGRLDSEYLDQTVFLIIIIVPAKIWIFWAFKLYQISFRYMSLGEVIKILKACLVSFFYFVLVTFLLKGLSVMSEYPSSLPVVDFLLTFIVSSGMRLIFRVIYFSEKKKWKARKVIMVGAGSAGEELLRKINASLLPVLPVAFVDDDKDKRGYIIHGVKVMGAVKDIPRLASSLNADGVIISMPSASSPQLKEAMCHIRQANITDIKILPGLFHVLTGEAKLGALKDIDIEDILGRKPVKFDLGDIGPFIGGKKVLITGAGGSIGSELCRQVASLSPAKLIMVDVGDTELFYIDKDIREGFPEIRAAAVIADVKDRVNIGNILSSEKPDIVFHAAAYKHVPIMESNAREAVLNNVEGTKVLAEAALKSGAGKFVFISTDKAVNPTSVMGATKRVSENLIRCLESDKTKFVSVRFGNVLESRGSIVPVIKEEIKKGGPVTITHPDMQRYFMSITEAVYLVMKAGAIAKGGEIFILDMGEQVKILDLAYEIIRFYGLEPDKDMPVVFTGVRPGEKLSEELLTVKEKELATEVDKIFVSKDTDKPGSDYPEKVDRLISESKAGASLDRIITMLKELVPLFNHAQDAP